MSENPTPDAPRSGLPLEDAARPPWLAASWVLRASLLLSKIPTPSALIVVR